MRGQAAVGRRPGRAPAPAAERHSARGRRRSSQSRPRVNGSAARAMTCSHMVGRCYRGVVARSSQPRYEARKPAAARASATASCRPAAPSTRSISSAARRPSATPAAERARAPGRAPRGRRPPAASGATGRRARGRGPARRRRARRRRRRRAAAAAGRRHRAAATAAPHRTGWPDRSPPARPPVRRPSSLADPAARRAAGRRRRQGELRAAESLDEVAAPDAAALLHLAQDRDRRLRSRRDAASAATASRVTTPCRSSSRRASACAPFGRRRRPSRPAPLRWLGRRRPATSGRPPRAGRCARRPDVGARPPARRGAASAAPAAARTCRWSRRPPRPGPRARRAARARRDRRARRPARPRRRPPSRSR